MDRFGSTGKVSKNWSTFRGGPLFSVGPIRPIIDRHVRLLIARVELMWSDRTKIALGEKIFRKKKLADTFLLFIC